MINTKKGIVLLGLIQGSIFAIIMALFDYYDGTEFNIKKFIVHFVVFGGIMAFFQAYQMKKKNKQ
jgi:hypothetical protein